MTLNGYEITGPYSDLRSELFALDDEYLTLPSLYGARNGSIASLGRYALNPTLDMSEGNRVIQPESPYRVDQYPTELVTDLHERITARREDLESRGYVLPDISMIRINEGSRFGDIARYVEALEFKNAWDDYKDVPVEKFDQEMQTEYSPYDSESRFILLLDTQNLDENEQPILVGMARIVGGDTKLLKTVHDMPITWDVSEGSVTEDIKQCSNTNCKNIAGIGDPAYTEDYSSLAVTGDYRSSDAYPIISHELYRWSTERNMTTITTIFVVNLLRLYRIQGVPFRVIAGVEPRVHMGELSLPAVMHLPEVPDMLNDPKKPRAVAGYNQMAEGQGLDYVRFSVN